MIIPRPPDASCIFYPHPRFIPSFFPYFPKIPSPSSHSLTDDANKHTFQRRCGNKVGRVEIRWTADANQDTVVSAFNFRSPSRRQTGYEFANVFADENDESCSDRRANLMRGFFIKREIVVICLIRVFVIFGILRYSFYILRYCTSRVDSYNNVDINVGVAMRARCTGKLMQLHGGKGEKSGKGEQKVELYDGTFNRSISIYGFHFQKNKRKKKSRVEFRPQRLGKANSRKLVEL